MAALDPILEKKSNIVLGNLSSLGEKLRELDRELDKLEEALDFARVRSTSGIGEDEKAEPPPRRSTLNAEIVQLQRFADGMVSRVGTLVNELDL
jgi:hypothetical protein